MDGYRLIVRLLLRSLNRLSRLLLCLHVASYRIRISLYLYECVLEGRNKRTRRQTVLYYIYSKRDCWLEKQCSLSLSQSHSVGKKLCLKNTFHALPNISDIPCRLAFDTAKTLSAYLGILS